MERKNSAQKTFLTTCLALLLSAGCSLPLAIADSLDVSSYEFIPRWSTLHQTGGFAGVDIDFTVMGAYDFAVERATTPIAAPQVQFENVDAWAAHPILAYVLPLDETLNLSRLEGQPLVGDSDGLALYAFRGEDHQGAPLELHVATLDRWMYVRGKNDPPCCDFFDYTIRAVARQTPTADFTDDGEVGWQDLEVWSQNFGNEVSEASRTTGSDFLLWQRQMGESAPTPEAFEVLLEAALAADGAPATAAVPEPSSGALLAVATVLFSGRPIRRIRLLRS